MVLDIVGSLASRSLMHDIKVIVSKVICDTSLRQVVVSIDTGDIRVVHKVQWLRQVICVHISATGGVLDVMEIALRSSL